MPTKRGKSMFGPTQTNYESVNSVLEQLVAATQNKIPNNVDEVNTLIATYNAVIQQIKDQRKKVGGAV